MNENFPVVTVKWADHYSMYDQGYTLSDVEALVKKPCIRISTGHLIVDGKRQLALAGTIDKDEDGNVTFSEIFVCMKKSIIERSDRENNK